MMKPFLFASTAILLATSAMAQTRYPAVLEDHAVLPALTLVPPPADAPEQLQISGRYAGPPGQRVDAPESAPGISALSDKAAPRPTGISLPLKGQPVQGLSGIKNMKDGTFLTLTDNGFGSKANSPDAMLMFHVVKPDWGLSVQLRGRYFHSSHPGEYDYFSPRWYSEVLPVVQLRRYSGGWRYSLAAGIGAQRDSGSDWRSSRYVNAQVTSPAVGGRWFVKAGLVYSNTPVGSGYVYDYTQFNLALTHAF